MKRVWSNKELKSFLVFLFFSFLLLLLDHFQVLQPVKAFSERLFLPPKKAIYRNWQELEVRVRDRVRVRNCEEVKELEEKIKKLEDEIAILNTKYSILNTKYLAARRLLGTPLPPDWQFLPAHTAGLVDGILTIDKGQVDGVEVGQAVLVEDIFVGKVERVGKYTARVRLPVAKDSKLLAKVIPDDTRGNTKTQNPDVPSGRGNTEIKAKGLLVGYGEKMKLEKVLQEEQLAEGDLVVTSEFPPNLVIGKIKKVVKDEVEIYQEVEVKPLVNYQKLEAIFLLK